MRLENMCDEDLAESAKDEIYREDSLGILFERYNDKLMRYLNSLNSNRVSQQDKEDILQETFFNICKKINLYQKMNGSKFEDWAYKIARNNFVNHLRKNKIIFEDKYHDAISENYSDEEIQTEQESQLISQVLDSLDETALTIFKEFYFEQLKYQEIADKHNFHISKVKSCLFRGKKKLAEELESRGFNNIYK